MKNCTHDINKYFNINIFREREREREREIFEISCLTPIYMK